MISIQWFGNRQKGLKLLEAYKIPKQDNWKKKFKNLKRVEKGKQVNKKIKNRLKKMVQI